MDFPLPRLRWGPAIVRIRSRRYCAARLPWAPQRAKDLNGRLLGHSLGAEAAPPSTKDASPRCPGRWLKADGALYGAALIWSAPETRRSAGSALKAPAALARRALCAQAGSSTFFRVAPLLRRPNGRLGESALAHSLALIEPSQRLQRLQRALLPVSVFYFSLLFFFRGVPSVPKIPRLPLSCAASGPCSTACSTVPPAHTCQHPLVRFSSPLSQVPYSHTWTGRAWSSSFPHPRPACRKPCPASIA